MSAPFPIPRRRPCRVYLQSTICSVIFQRCALLFSFLPSSLLTPLVCQDAKYPQNTNHTKHCDTKQNAHLPKHFPHPVTPSIPPSTGKLSVCVWSVCVWSVCVCVLVSPDGYNSCGQMATQQRWPSIHRLRMDTHRHTQNAHKHTHDQSSRDIFFLSCCCFSSGSYNLLLKAA